MATHQRHALITGGSSGIGLGIATGLIARGWNVTIVARDKTRLAQAAAQLSEQRVSPQQQVLSLVADVAERAAIEAAVNEAVARSDGPDMLVTSAGICEPGRVEDLPVEVFEQTIRTNYLGSLYAVLACLPAMRSRGHGRIMPRRWSNWRSTYARWSRSAPSVVGGLNSGSELTPALWSPGSSAIRNSSTIFGETP